MVTGRVPGPFTVRQGGRGRSKDAVFKTNPKHRDSVLLGYAPNVTPNSISGFLSL